MLQWLWLIPAFPYVGFLVLAVAGGRFSRRLVAMVGVGSVGLSSLMALVAAISFLNSSSSDAAFTQVLWRWMEVGGFAPRVGLYLDALSLVMMLVITFVGVLIHLYSSEFMSEDEGYSRFFAYMNLFVGSMLTLILADNLVLLYLGWEGVGLCSYLLIGFWYSDPANGRAAQKAFIVTRVGDTTMAIGLFLLFWHLGTLDIQEMMARALRQWPAGSMAASIAAALLLGGALGKSAQLPLQTWLPDAMAGPTPVSALIHAATMVTAGVYLIARLHLLYTLSPHVQFAVAVIGAATLLVAGFSALTQRDIKRVLAYSTISQIGYMFLALGVGAWSAAIFHFMTHAFFKALLFLAAGAVIRSLHDEHDIFRMGGLRKELPLTFWTFLIAGASLAGFPLVTAGFYSKDWILWEAWSSGIGSPWLWAAGWIGAWLTAIYIFRVVFVVFFGTPLSQVSVRPGRRIEIPLVILAILSMGAGFLEMPRSLGDVSVFSNIISAALPRMGAPHADAGVQLRLQALAMVASLLGIYLAYRLFYRSSRLVDGITRSPAGTVLHRFWFAGWGCDWLYDRLLVRPFLWIARANKDDVVDTIYQAAAFVSQRGHRALRLSQTGRVRSYAAAIAAGAVLIVAIVLLS